MTQIQHKPDWCNQTVRVTGLSNLSHNYLPYTKTASSFRFGWFYPRQVFGIWCYSENTCASLDLQKMTTHTKWIRSQESSWSVTTDMNKDRFKSVLKRCSDARMYTRELLEADPFFWTWQDILIMYSNVRDVGTELTLFVAAQQGNTVWTHKLPPDATNSHCGGLISYTGIMLGWDLLSDSQITETNNSSNVQIWGLH